MKKYIAEVIGTFGLVFAGTAAIMTHSSSNSAVGLIGVALAFGLIIMAMIYAIGDISGAHMNPAVTLGMVLARKLPVRDVIPYWISQLAGALIASFAVKSILGDQAHLGATFISSGTVTQSLVLEAVLTFFLVFTALNASGPLAGVAIGMVITLDIFAGGNVSGASMNPARTLGPAVIDNYYPHLWIYIVGPFLGAIVAAGLWAVLRADAHAVKKSPPLMLSLRNKLWVGFGGLLLTLLAVTALSFVVMSRYRDSLQRAFHENYDSALYCQRMKEALDQLNLHCQELLDPSAPAIPPAADDSEADFSRELALQTGNVTLPREADLTQQLAASWKAFDTDYQQFKTESPANRALIYRRNLWPRIVDMQSAADQIADLNMSNMVKMDQNVRTQMGEARTVMLILVAAGTLVAAILVGAAGTAVLRSLRALTRSARQIESGDLDLSAPVIGQDEIGQLGQAFNSMAEKLREFRRLDAQRLLRVQRTTQLAIDSLPDAVFVIGPDESVEISNRTAQTHFAIEPGKTLKALKLPWLSQIHEQVVTERHSVSTEAYKAAIQLFENGQERFLLPHAAPMTDDHGKVIGVIVILADVTHLRKADEIKSGLLRTVSHELRTPLTSIRMGILMLTDGTLGPLTDRQNKSLAMVRNESDRLCRTIENLLSISRIEAGQTLFHFDAMPVTLLLSQAVEPLRAAFAEKSIQLAASAPNPKWMVRADPSSVGLALGNLLSNALKFTPGGGRTTVEVQEDGDFIQFRVSDSGSGVPAEFGERIFEKFFRAPHKEGPTGAGLGLAIAREVIQAHGGTLYLQGGQGSTFVFTLPKAEK